MAYCGLKDRKSYNERLPFTCQNATNGKWLDRCHIFNVFHIYFIFHIFRIRHCITWHEFDIRKASSFRWVTCMLLCTLTNTEMSTDILLYCHFFIILRCKANLNDIPWIKSKAIVLKLFIMAMKKEIKVKLMVSCSCYVCMRIFATAVGTATIVLLMATWRTTPTVG